jgi:hypothetical protein
VFILPLQAIRNLFPFIVLKAPTSAVPATGVAGSGAAAAAAAAAAATAAAGGDAQGVWPALCKRILITDTSCRESFIKLTSDVKDILVKAAVPVDSVSDSNQQDGTSATVNFTADPGQKFTAASFPITLNSGALRAAKMLGNWKGEYLLSRPCVRQFIACLHQAKVLLASHSHT